MQHILFPKPNWNKVQRKNRFFLKLMDWCVGGGVGGGVKNMGFAFRWLPLKKNFFLMLEEMCYLNKSVVWTHGMSRALRLGLYVSKRLASLYQVNFIAWGLKLWVSGCRWVQRLMEFACPRVGAFNRCCVAWQLWMRMSETLLESCYSLRLMKTDEYGSWAGEK